MFLSPLSGIIRDSTIHKRLSIPSPKKRKRDNATTTGIISVTPKGFGFVTPDEKDKTTKDIFIPGPLLRGAIDGDRVECYIDSNSRSKKGPEGGVLTVLERSKSEVLAVIESIEGKDLYSAYAPALGPNKPVFIRSKKEYDLGDRLLVKIVEWGDRKVQTKADVVEFIGHLSDPRTDIPAALYEFSVPHVFPHSATEEALAYGDTVQKKDCEGRIDLTELETFTIDPTTAKDFDDALSLKIAKDGTYELGVHIADVSHYVREGSSLDAEAQVRCNSTYFPGKCIPMIPHELSDNLCSLRENVIRLTISVFMRFSPKGELIDHSIHKAYIKSQKRFSYEDALEVLEGKKKSTHGETLHLMVKLCQILKKQRAQRGSVDLALSEHVILVDDDGNPTGTKIVEYDITHQLVEEFMLKANEVIASEFVEAGMPTVFRIHDEPQTETMKEFYAMARLLGFDMPAEPTAHDVQKLFTLVKHTEFAEQISIAYIRSMKLAVYSHENVGHYGLCLDHYCHFTSPIRRYSDLVVHRMLFSRKVPERIEAITERCSDRERNSFKAEQSVLQLKRLRMLLAQFEEDPYHTYDVVISKVKPHGVYFDLKEIGYSGYLHLSHIGDDFYEYDSDRNILYGTGKGHELALGNHIKVSLVRIDLIRGNTEWELLAEEKPTKSKKKKKKKSRSC